MPTGHAVGFTGSREGMTPEQFETFRLTLHELDMNEFHHGDCVGSDAEAHEWVQQTYPDSDHIIVIHPPDNPDLRAFCTGGTILRPKPRLPRNRDIVDACSILIATPRPWSRGTRYTIGYGHKMRRSVCVIDANGSAVWTDGAQ